MRSENLAALRPQLPCKVRANCGATAGRSRANGSAVSAFGLGAHAGQRGRQKRSPGTQRQERSNAREQEILRWIYLGKTNGEVGAILSLSSQTVKNHVQKILHKLNVFNRTQAVAKALDTRILSPCTLESAMAGNAGEVDPIVAICGRDNP